MGVFLQQPIANIPVIAFVELSKRHVAKRSLQTSFNNQILDYKAMLDLCENEMISTLFGICKETMISVENLEIEKWYEGGDTVSVTLCSHQILHKNFCQQHDQSAVLRLLNYFYFESFLSHII